MKGLILAGGKGTRLYPTTKVVNKHLLLVFNKPLIMYPIETLRNSGITDITITLSKYDPDQFMKLLGDGSELGVNLSYVIHGEARGISHAIYHAKHIIGKEPFVCLLGDNIFVENLKCYVENFERNPEKILVLFKEVGFEEAKRYGVAKFGRNPSGAGLMLAKVIEKPENPPSRCIMLGAYFLNKKFFEIYPTLKRSERGEYEITEAINSMILDVEFEFYKGAWFDCGEFDSILDASNYLRERNEN